jgi:hypothetical protein
MILKSAEFYERYLVASDYNDPTLLPDPEEGLDEMFLADLAIAGPASEEDSTGRSESVVPTVTNCEYLHFAFGGGCPHCYVPKTITVGPLRWAELMGAVNE